MVCEIDSPSVVLAFCKASVHSLCALLSICAPPFHVNVLSSSSGGSCVSLLPRVVKALVVVDGCVPDPDASADDPVGAP